MDGALRAFSNLSRTTIKKHQLVLNDVGDEVFFRAKAKKWNLYTCTARLAKVERGGLTDKQFTEKVDKALAAFNFIKIVPHRIVLRQYHPDFSMPKYEWCK